MRVTPRAIVGLTLAAAVVVFCVVQDRVTAAGAREYVARQRAALAGCGAPVTIDAIVVPAVERSVREALLWSGVVVVAGGMLAVVVRRRA